MAELERLWQFGSPARKFTLCIEKEKVMTCIEKEKVMTLISDSEVATLVTMSRSWVRQQRFRRRHGKDHVFTVDPVQIGSTPRYRREEVESWIEEVSAGKGADPTLNLSKPVQTKDGRVVKLITVSGRDPWPVVGYIEGQGKPQCWMISGEQFHSQPRNTDLVNVVVKHVYWVNLYPDGVGYVHSSRKQADDYRCRSMYDDEDCIACIKVEVKEGEGLDDMSVSEKE